MPVGSPIKRNTGGFGSPATTQQQYGAAAAPYAAAAQPPSARGAPVPVAAPAPAAAAAPPSYAAEAELNSSGEFASPRGGAGAGGDGGDDAPQQFSTSGTWPSLSALPSKAGLDPIERERREVERRRARFDDRRNRILQAKTRIIGIDKQALDSQVKEKEDRKKKELEEKLYYDQLTASHAQLLSEVERERQRVRASKDEEMAFYRRQQELAARKKKSDEREYQLAKVPPSHPLDASMAGQQGQTVFLDFKGEDLGKAQRESEQKRQQQAWLEQQLNIQNQRQSQQRQDEADYANQVKNINELKKQMEAEAAAARASLHKQTQQYNSVQSNYKKNMSNAARAQDAAAKEQEIQYQLRSEILNEKATADALRTNFKGFSTEQRVQIANEQNQQIRDLQAKRTAEVNAEADYAKMQDDVLREMLRRDQQKANAEAEARQQLRATHLHQSKEHRENMRRLNKEVYTNPVSNAFFDQFGTSHR